MEAEKGKPFPVEKPPESPESEVKPPALEVFLGDITKIEVEAIVNAANKTLSGGGGVDGAIHAAAGPELDKECEKLVEESGRCPTGEARLTKGYNLLAKFVIHTVGPIYGREHGKEAELLAECYRNSLALAIEKKIRSIAFSSISTGLYGYPKERAARIAVKTVRDFLNENPGVFDKVIFVVFKEKDLEIYQKLVV